MSGEYIERGGKLFPTPFSTEEKGDYRQGWNHCLRAIYQMPAADVMERPRWISVKERMPEDGKNVLAYEGGGFYFLDWCCDGKWVVASESIAVVTHWMPLPEPPKEET